MLKREINSNLQSVCCSQFLLVFYLVLPHNIITSRIFCTLTFSPQMSLDDCWQSCSKLFNRFHQRYKRKISHAEYIRTIEIHKNGRPHIHCVIQSLTPFSCKHGYDKQGNTKYFCSKGHYLSLRDLWTLGHSDFVFLRPNVIEFGSVPSDKQTTSWAMHYVLKYTVKDSTSRTLRKKLFPNYKPDISKRKSIIKLPDSVEHTAFLELLKKNKIRQCSWSRGFKFT